MISRIRGLEIQRILDHAGLTAGPAVIAGDFNSIGKWFSGYGGEDSIRLTKSAGFTDALGKVGGSTHKLCGRIDWIFLRGPSLLKGLRGDYGGSDHRWIFAEFSLYNG